MELLKYIFTLPDVTSFLSQRVCQDAIEQFFPHVGTHDEASENDLTTQIGKVPATFHDDSSRASATECQGR